MTFEGLDASAALRALVCQTAGSGKLPHLDSLVQATANEILSIGRESNGVDAVLVAIGALETLNQIAVLDIPHADTLVKRASGDIFGVR